MHSNLMKLICITVSPSSAISWRVIHVIYDIHEHTYDFQKHDICVYNEITDAIFKNFTKDLSDASYIVCYSKDFCNDMYDVCIKWNKILIWKAIRRVKKLILKNPCASYVFAHHRQSYKSLLKPNLGQSYNIMFNDPDYTNWNIEKSTHCLSEIVVKFIDDGWIFI
jgi:hypothetical protein